MIFNITWKWIDEWLCQYLGLGNYRLKPKDAILKDSQIIVSFNEPFKRHLLKENTTIHDLAQRETFSEKDREKLGLAVGKAISPKLIISFEKITLKPSKK